MTPVALPRFAGQPPEAVTFDYWDTLICTRTSGTREARRTALAAALADTGVDVDGDRLEAALDHAVAVYTESWHANHQFTAEDGAISVLDHLGLALRPADQEVFVTAFVRSAVDLRPSLTPRVTDALSALRAAGVRLGIVCDVGLTASDVLRSYLEHHRVLELFDHWSFSDEVGVYKPDPRIFRHALDGLGGVDPAGAVHVGDLRRTDVAGARAVGMATVRYSGRNDDGAVVPEGGPEAATGQSWPDADVVVNDHADLAGVLGVLGVGR